MTDETFKDIERMLEDKSISFKEMYEYLHEKEIGYWDNVNDEETIRQYCSEMLKQNIIISHILEVLEQNPSPEELYEIWLGNSLETPSPIRTKKELVSALGLSKYKRYDVIVDFESFTTTIEAKSKMEAEQKAIELVLDFDRNDLDCWVAECSEEEDDS